MQMVKQIVVAQDLIKNKEVNQMIIQSLAYFLLFAFPLTLWKWKLLSCVQLFASPWTVQSMEFSRPEHWSG